MKFLLVQFGLIIILFSSKSFASGSGNFTWISDYSDSDAPEPRVVSQVSNTASEVTNSRKRPTNGNNENRNVNNENSDIFLEYPKLLIEQIEAMKDQEETDHYKGINFFDLEVEVPFNEDDEDSFEVNQIAREQMTEWKFQVIDHFGMNRKTVALSLKLLDRYLAHCKVSNEPEEREVYYTKKGYQLAAMATLYLAIKVQEPVRLNISSLKELSRGFFTIEQFYKAEQRIIDKLDYRINFPLEADYLSRFKVLLGSVDFLDKPLNDNILLGAIFGNALFLTELSQSDSFFIQFSSANIAFAALVNAMEYSSYRIKQNSKMRIVSLDDETKSKIYRKANAEFSLIYNSREIIELSNRLMFLYNSWKQVYSR